MTKPMIDALRRMKAEGPLETTKHARAGHLSGQTAKALRRRGFAKPISYDPIKYEITAAGVEALKVYQD